MPRIRTSDFWYYTLLSFGLEMLILFTQIVDSIMALFRVDFSGRGELSERQQKVSDYLHARTCIVTYQTVLVGTDAL